VLLPFARGARAPGLVIKGARLPEFTGHTEREQATLTALRARLDPDLRRTLPEPLGAVGNGGRHVFAETSVPGQMLAASIGRWRAPARRQIEDLRLAADWLARFHLATMVRREPWSAAEIERWIEPALAGYERDLGIQPDERRLFDAIRRRATSLVGEALPIVWVHNDFGPWHIYRLGTDVSVIDWEFAGESVTERQGLPLCDLAYFVVHWTHLAHGLKGDAGEIRGFARLVFGTPGRDRRIDAARGALAEYMRRLEISTGFLPLLIALTWVDRARDKCERQVTLGASMADPRQDNRFVRYVEILARRADELFGTAHRTR
jgi:aminoglycoside phosphotransferase (APT) family kinase protein